MSLLCSGKEVQHMSVSALYHSGKANKNKKKNTETKLLCGASYVICQNEKNLDP